MRVRLRHERLAQALAESPVTLNRWAQRMGLRSGHLSQLANGKRLYPTARTRQKILDALGLEFDELFVVETPQEASGPEKPPAPRPFSDLGAPQPRPRAPVPRRSAMMSGFERSGWWLDLRYALRSLVRRPAHSLAIVVTLALGLGVNLAIFEVADSVLLEPLPHEAPDRLFAAFTIPPEKDGRSGFSWPDALDFRQRLDRAIDLAVADWEPFALAGGDRPTRVGGGRVTENYARVAGVEMLRGRFFDTEEQQRGAPVVVLGEGLWRSSFGSDPAIVGREILLDGRSVRVIGVAPHHLDLLDDCELFVPLQASTDPDLRDSFWLRGFARIAPDLSALQAEDRLRQVADTLAAEHPRTHEGRSAELVPLRRLRTADLRPALLMLLGVGAAILLTVCANVANLLLSRSRDRGAEMGLRAALGAARPRLLRQLLTESALLTTLGLALGSVVAFLAIRLLESRLPSTLVPGWFEVVPDLRTVLFAVVLTTLTTLLFGTAPAWVQTRSLGGAVRGGRGARGGGWRTRQLLVVAQVAVCCVLLVGSGLMLRSLSRLTGNPTGFDTQNAVVVGLDLLALQDRDEGVRGQRFLEHYRALEGLPGVQAVGAIDRLALAGSSNLVGVTVENPAVDSYDPFLLLSTVTTGYFEAAGIPILEGTDFELESANPQPQIVVSRRLAEAFWPGETALGKRLKIGRPDDDRPWLEVRGVVGDVRHQGLDRAPRPMLYQNEGALGMRRSQWIVRSELPPTTLIPEIRTAVASVDPNQPLWGVRTLEQHVDRAAWQERFLTTLVWLLASLALTVAAVGLSGLLVAAVQQRRHEIGIQLALGATSRQVGRRVGLEGLALVGLGLCLGIPASLAVGRVLAGRLYGVEGLDVTVSLGVLAVLLMVGLLAVWIPARRAAGLDPATALRIDD